MRSMWPMINIETSFLDSNYYKLSEKAYKLVGVIKDNEKIAPGTCPAAYESRKIRWWDPKSRSKGKHDIVRKLFPATSVYRLMPCARIARNGAIVTGINTAHI